MKISSIIKLNEFLPYFFIGAAATILDWALFWAAITWLNFHYEAALVFSYTMAGLFHFASNKIITFKCHSKKIGSQYSIYIIVAVSTLLISMGIIAIFVNIFMLNKMLSRILTTIIMLMPNYLLHKHITFNKKIFIQPTGY